MSDLGVEADPMSRKQIRSFALQSRDVLGYSARRYVDIEKLLDFDLPKKLPGFVYDVRDERELGETHGLAKPDDNLLFLREDVFERACEGKGRDRLTVIHELGHILLHKSDRISHRRATGSMKAFRDPEWQANAFAGEFLVASNHIEGLRTIDEVAREFGVSRIAAQVQLKAYHKDQLISEGQIRDLTLF